MNKLLNAVALLHLCMSTTAQDLCRRNEMYTECGKCEATCSRPKRQCPWGCLPPRCECVAALDYVRDRHGACVKISECKVPTVFVRFSHGGAYRHMFGKLYNEGVTGEGSAFRKQLGSRSTPSDAPIDGHLSADHFPEVVITANEASLPFLTEFGDISSKLAGTFEHQNITERPKTLSERTVENGTIPPWVYESAKMLPKMKATSIVRQAPPEASLNLRETEDSISPLRVASAKILYHNVLENEPRLKTGSESTLRSLVGKGGFKESSDNVITTNELQHTTTLETLVKPALISDSQIPAPSTHTEQSNKVTTQNPLSLLRCLQAMSMLSASPGASNELTTESSKTDQLNSSRAFAVSPFQTIPEVREDSKHSSSTPTVATQRAQAESDAIYTHEHHSSSTVKSSTANTVTSRATTDDYAKSTSENSVSKFRQRGSLVADSIFSILPSSLLSTQFSPQIRNYAISAKKSYPEADTLSLSINTPYGTVFYEKTPTSSAGIRMANDPYKLLIFNDAPVNHNRS